MHQSTDDPSSLTDIFNAQQGGIDRSRCVVGPMAALSYFTSLAKGWPWVSHNRDVSLAITGFAP